MAKFLSESDGEKLMEMWNWFKNQVNGPTPTAATRNTKYTPDVFIAKPPSGGIPPLSECVGTGTCLGTGSGINYDSPGIATCTIYRVDTSNNFQLIPSIRKPVLNLTQSTITDDWITVVRTKFNEWIALVSGSSSSSTPTIIDAICTSDVSEETTSFGIDSVNIVQPSGSAWTGSFTEPTSLDNWAGVRIDADTSLLVFYDEGRSEWRYWAASDCAEGTGTGTGT